MSTQKCVIDELRKADRIINVMLNAMTTEQKSKCAAQLEREGVSPDGMTRAHERSVVLASVGVA